MRRIQEFLNTQHSFKATTIRSYLAAIKAFDKTANVEFEDIYLNEKKIQDALSQLHKNYSDSTWNLFLVQFKRYAKWLSDPEDEECPKFWRKINPIPIDWEMKLKDKWLTEEEFRRILDVVDYSRDKTMYGVAVEGALRMGELLGLRIRDCTKTSYGFDVTVSGKTGSGSFPVVLFAPLLTQWLNFHPFKHNLDAPLWPRRTNKFGNRCVAVQKSSVGETFQRYAKLAGITRDVSIHILRHTKITWTAKDTSVGVSDEMAKKMFRWSKNSRMYSRYTHLFGTDSTRTYLALAGVKSKDSNANPIEMLKPVSCLNCGELNEIGALYCSKCGFVLDAEQAKKLIERQKLMDLMAEMLSDPENMKKLLGKKGSL